MYDLMEMQQTFPFPFKHNKFSY